jgi:N-acetylglutamate synthase-like GNAT family acetyltransferase
MKIIDLTPKHEPLYFCCLKDWSDEMKESGDHKAIWYARMKDKGIRVKLAEDDNGTIGGMIQYVPIEISQFEGKDLYVVLCIWVHGYKQGRGNFRKTGMGKALLDTTEEDVKQLGAKGLVTWGLNVPFFMRASWFKRRGYKVVDKYGLMRLLWKPFSADAEPPSFMEQRRKLQSTNGKVSVTAFMNGWCPAQNITYERTKRAARDFGDKIGWKDFDTTERAIQKEWGFSDAIFIDKKMLRTGPPPSYEKIRRKIEKKVRKIE